MASLPTFEYTLNCEFVTPKAATPSSSTPKAPSGSTTTPTAESVIADIRRVAEQHGANLAAIKDAAESAEVQRKERIVKSLQAVADLELTKGTKARRFQLAYWYCNDVHKTEGVEYPVERDGDGDVIGYSVLIDDYRRPFCGRAETMNDFQKFFTSRNIPYAIAYFDEADKA